MNGIMVKILKSGFAKRKTEDMIAKAKNPAIKKNKIINPAKKPASFKKFFCLIRSIVANLNTAPKSKFLKYLKLNDII